MKLVSINGSDVSGFDVDKVIDILKDVTSTERVLIFKEPNKGIGNEPSHKNIAIMEEAKAEKKENNNTLVLKVPPGLFFTYLTIHFLFPYYL